LSIKVIGIGNPYRGDDAAGRLVACKLRGRLPSDVQLLERSEDAATLLDDWDPDDDIIVVDAVCSGSPAGTIHRLDPAKGPLPDPVGVTSSHALGLATALELARSLGRLPRSMVVFGIEARAFEIGSEPSSEVVEAAEQVAVAVLDYVSHGIGEHARA
jgi:hydrogenase maturation protease